MQTSVNYIDSNDLSTFKPLENELIIKSEFLIEKQREHIKDLKQELLEIRNRFKKKYDKLELQNKSLIEANGKLNLEIDILRGELEVLEQKIQSTMYNEKILKDQLDSAKTQLHLINDRNSLLEKKLAKLKSNNGEAITANARSTNSNNDKAASEYINEHEKLQKLRNNIEAAENLLEMLNMKAQEAKVNLACVNDSEYELLECYTILNKQKEELSNLHKVVAYLNNNKNLIPPTILINNMSLKQNTTDNDYYLDENGILNAQSSSIVNRNIDNNNYNFNVIKSNENTVKSNIADEKFKYSSVDSDILFALNDNGIGNKLNAILVALKNMLNSNFNENQDKQTIELLTAQFSELVNKLSTQIDNKHLVSDSRLTITTNHTQLHIDPNDIPNSVPEFTMQLDLFEKKYNAKDVSFSTKLFNFNPNYINGYNLNNLDQPIYKIYSWNAICILNEADLSILLRHQPYHENETAECHVIQAKDKDEYEKLLKLLEYSNIIKQNGNIKLHEYVDGKLTLLVNGEDNYSTKSKLFIDENQGKMQLYYMHNNQIENITINKNEEELTYIDNTGTLIFNINKNKLNYIENFYDVGSLQNSDEITLLFEPNEIRQMRKFYPIIADELWKKKNIYESMESYKNANNKSIITENIDELNNKKLPRSKKMLNRSKTTLGTYLTENEMHSDTMEDASVQNIIRKINTLKSSNLKKSLSIKLNKDKSKLEANDSELSLSVNKKGTEDNTIIKTNPKQSNSKIERNESATYKSNLSLNVIRSSEDASSTLSSNLNNQIINQNEDESASNNQTISDKITINQLNIDGKGSLGATKVQSKIAASDYLKDVNNSVSITINLKDINKGSLEEQSESGSEDDSNSENKTFEASLSYKELLKETVKKSIEQLLSNEVLEQKEEEPEKPEQAPVITMVAVVNDDGLQLYNSTTNNLIDQFQPDCTIYPGKEDNTLSIISAKNDNQNNSSIYKYNITNNMQELTTQLIMNGYNVKFDNIFNETKSVFAAYPGRVETINNNRKKIYDHTNSKAIYLKDDNIVEIASYDENNGQVLQKLRLFLSSDGLTESIFTALKLAQIPVSGSFATPNIEGIEEIRILFKSTTPLSKYLLYNKTNDTYGLINEQYVPNKILHLNNQKVKFYYNETDYSITFVCRLTRKAMYLLILNCNFTAQISQLVDGLLSAGFEKLKVIDNAIKVSGYDICIRTINQQLEIVLLKKRMNLQLHFHSMLFEARKIKNTLFELTARRIKTNNIDLADLIRRTSKYRLELHCTEDESLVLEHLFAAAGFYATDTTKIETVKDIRINFNLYTSTPVYLSIIDQVLAFSKIDESKIEELKYISTIIRKKCYYGMKYGNIMSIIKPMRPHETSDTTINLLHEFFDPSFDLKIPKANKMIKKINNQGTLDLEEFIND